jgi:hypothetical protein
VSSDRQLRSQDHYKSIAVGEYGDESFPGGGGGGGPHTHPIGDVVGLQAELDGKADDVHAHPIGDVTFLQAALDGKAPVAHAHAIGDVTGLQAALDGKAGTVHAHAGADITSGTVDAARLGANAPTSAKVLFGDSAWDIPVVADISGLAAELDAINAELDTAVHLAGQLGGSEAAPDVRGVRETAGPTLLALGAVADGDFLKRVGATVVGGQPAGGASDVVYVPTTADVAINSVTDITVVTRDVTGLAAGQQVIVEAWFTILNNSGATRVITVTLDFDGLFDVEIATGALATSSSLMHPFHLTAVFDLRSISLCYAIVELLGQLAAGVAAGGDVTMGASHLRGMSWGTSASDASGTLTVALKVRSASATATQTLRLHHFTIRKNSPT